MTSRRSCASAVGLFGERIGTTPSKPLDGSTLRGCERINLLLADLELHAPARHDSPGVDTINSIDLVAIAVKQGVSPHIAAALDKPTLERSGRSRCRRHGHELSC